MEVKWIIESFSIINCSIETLEYDKLNINQKLIGSFDYMGYEGYDNFLINSENNEIVYVGLTVPQEFVFENNFFKAKNITLLNHGFNNLYSKLNKNTVFNEPSISILDSKLDELICLSSLEDKFYQTININEDFLLLFINWEYKGFVLKNALKKINNYNENKIDIRLDYYLIKMFELVNSNIYDKMENEDALILQKLKHLKTEFLGINDDRALGAINFINNCIYAFY